MIKQKDKILSDLKYINKNTKINPLGKTFLPNSKFPTKWIENKGSYEIKENKRAKKRMVELVDFILKVNSQRKISEEKIKEELKKIIFNESFETKQSSNNYLQTSIKLFCEKLNKTNNQIFFFRVYNLTTTKKINFGQISILPSEKSLKANMRHNFNGKMNLFGKLKIDESISCYAMIRTKKNPFMASKIAREKVREHLGMLSLMSGCALFLDGEIPESCEQVKYIEDNVLKSRMSNPYRNLFANPLHLKVFLNKGDSYKKSFMILSKILRKKDFKLNNKIILSSKWFLEYVKELSLENKVLKLAIALEVLLLERENSKRTTLCERITFLLYSKKGDRKKIFELVDEFYRLRNSLVHSGKFENNFRESLLKEVSYLYRKTIDKILIRKFGSIQEIDNYIQSKKFE